jgi:predicted MPP superfamily phosphohydrolase
MFVLWYVFTFIIHIYIPTNQLIYTHTYIFILKFTITINKLCLLLYEDLFFNPFKYLKYSCY